MPLTFLIGDWEQLLTAPSYIGLFERGLHSNLEIHQMQRDTKRDEVHGSVRYGTLDSPQGRIQGLPHARRRPARSTSAASSIGFEQDRFCPLQRLECMINARGPAALRP